MDKTSFDIILENPLLPCEIPVKSIGQILFDPLPDRDEKSMIILSHLENEFLEISLPHLRTVVKALNDQFMEKKIIKGDTVILISFNGCNEMLTAIYFIALASLGCRIFMPMYSETAEFSSWIDIAGASHVILPRGEVNSLEGHEKEKTAVRAIVNLACNKGLKIWDNITDFDILELLKPASRNMNVTLPEHDRSFIDTDPDDEVLIVTTSGTSGRSRLVVYTHRAYFKSCISWEQAGFYKTEVLGGTGFTPLFTHTMGIRAFINALWTGSPVCLIITEWFFEKPEIVRYLLLKMKPAHITGGPAVYNAFLEMFRIYPELKSGLGSHFKTLVSSGALYNPVTAREVLNATGMRLQNAFGTTETQQILSTLLADASVFKEEMIPLGRPLPGVIIGLNRTEISPDHYEMSVKSAFGHKCLIGEESVNNEGFFDTGDLVVLKNGRDLFYSGRLSHDYFKDNFGVKIPIGFLKEYYKELQREILHAEYFPVVNFPGIAALIFVKIPGCNPGQVPDGRILKHYSGVVEGINNKLINSLEPFEYQHRHICRVAVVNQSPPLTGKGSVSVKEIKLQYRELIEKLTDTRKDSRGIEITERYYKIADNYTKFISPRSGEMMASLKINFTYHRGLKDSLFVWLHGKEIEVLDMAGGYGANLTGHNHPVICDAATRFIEDGKIAVNNQASIHQLPGSVAEKLNLIVGSVTGKSYRVIFANSGSEAVEVALQHAYFEWKTRIEKIRDQQLQVFGHEKGIRAGEIWLRNMRIIEQARIRVICLYQGFHGDTIGSRSLIGNQKQRHFANQMSGIDPVFLKDNDQDWPGKIAEIIENSNLRIQKIVREGEHLVIAPFPISLIIAAIAEPVLGEGGVREVNRELLAELASFEFPFISDEIQCGLGRTGKLPENEMAHYYLFGKSLGGGIEKISAVMIESTRFRRNFSEFYVSTFGNGELACCVALATLVLIEEEHLVARSLERGDILAAKLDLVRKRYPEVIKSIEGKGLMMAIHFNPGIGSGNILLRILFQAEKAGYLFSGWFLNRHQIRILPSLSAPNSLRIEPSVFITGEEIDKFCDALNELCSILAGGKMYDLFSFLMDDDNFDEDGKSSLIPGSYNPVLELPADKAVRVAFLAHFVFPLRELRMLEPDFIKASDTGLRILFRRMEVLLDMKPIQIIATNLFEGRVHFSFYAIPLDSAELEYLHKAGKRNTVISRIQDAVDLASANGAEVISLGGYTSILTNNGLSLNEPAGTRIITGNTLTAASGLAHLGDILRKRPEFNKLNTVAVVGSTGNIGQILSRMLYEEKDICGELLLISRLGRREVDLFSHSQGDRKKEPGVRNSVNLYDLKDADVVIVCSNTNDPIIFPHHLSRDKQVIISDLSVPSALSPEVGRLENIHVYPFSSYVRLPADREVVISSYSPPGTVFCCAGEAILLGLEKCDETLKGKLMPEAVKAISCLASKYGFFENIDTLSSYKTNR